MSDVVECRQERSLPEYNQMRKTNLFSDNEIRLIIKTRESFEYKIGKQSEVIKDFCEYIAYERNLLTTIMERSKTRNLEQRKTNIVFSLTNHIKTLYKQALSRFPEEQRIWDQLFKFCKSSKLYTEVSAGFEKMLQFHSDKPHVWLRAVMWEYHDMHNMEKVSDLLLRGIQRHPNNSEIYIEFFKIMLNEASTKSNECILQNNQASEQSLELERVFVIYESAKKKIHKIEFFVELLNIAEEYAFAKTLQKRIIEDMMSSFSRDELMWDKLAQRELHGFHMSEIHDLNYDMKSLENENCINGNTGAGQKRLLTKTLRRRIEICVEVYETAVKELKTVKMWSLYINAMLELNRDVSTQQILKRKMLGAAFKGAHEANCMSENHYIHYIELLMSSDIDEEYILSVMQKATSIHCGSVHLWELWMHYHISKDEEDKVYEIFRKSIKKLAFEAHPLWRILLQYYGTRLDLQNKMEDIFKEAVNQNSQVFSPFKPQYIEWIAITKSMAAARKIYNDLVLTTPPCLELHQKMGSLDSMQQKPDIKSWRKSHEFATQHFGKDRTDVWINYIKFERDHGEAKNMNLIFEQAKAVLNPDLIDNLISEHCILTKGIV